MKIAAEPNCARRYRRLTSPMNVSIGGRVHVVKNWSPSGMLVQLNDLALQKERIEEGELLLPCLDGLYMLPVQILPLQFLSEGCGCRFVDMPPRERTLIHAYADMVMRGEIGKISDLEDCASITPPDEPPPASIMEPRQASFWRKMFQTSHFKRGAVIGVLILVILILTGTGIPFIIKGFETREAAKSEFMERATVRLDKEESVASLIDSKIERTRALLGENGKENPTVTPELSRIFNDGLGKLLRERQITQQRIETMKKIIRDAGQAAVFVPAAYEHLFVPDRPDPAPLLTKALNDASTESGTVIRSQLELDKYLLVAQARVKQAETALASTQVKRETLERILKRVDEAGPEAGFPLNQQEVMRRDVALLKLEEDRLTEMLKLLHDNVEAVKSGNLLYENKMLQRFDVEPNRSVRTAAESNLTD